MTLKPRSRLLAHVLTSSLALSVYIAPQLQAEVRVLPEGTLPNDRRLAPLKDLDGYFPFEPAVSPDEWQKRALELRRQVQVALGLWPMPEKTPLNPIIHGKVDRGDYTVEKVFFESAPGFYVTGNLYRPAGGSGKRPAFLSPHGHWGDGRFHDMGLQRVRQEIVEGSERFEEGGRSPLQARCVQLARMGCVVFHYDMLGYADSQQISYDLAHRFAKQRPEMNTVENWGLYSPQAEARLQGVMGLQTLNSIRALDFILQLPDVDPERVGVTGASGGGTQTFILAAIDPRPTLSFPAVMVSTAMQGGCTCENASLLRVGTGNIELAALFAPKPQGLTAANDWTREMEVKGFPELKKHYAMLGAPDNIMLKALIHFDHNYNYPNRAALYSWVNRHFHLGLPEPVVEEDYKRLSKEEMTVWNSEHPQPEGGEVFERKLLEWWDEDAQRQLQEASASQNTFARLAGDGVRAVLGRSLNEAGQLEFDLRQKSDRGEYLEMTGLLKNVTHGEELPIAFLYPRDWNGQTVIWLTEKGKAGLFLETGEINDDVGRLIRSGATVIGVDMLFQGEFVGGDAPVSKTRRVKNPREAAAYTFGYNPALFAQRVHDVLSVVKFVQANERPSKAIHLASFDSTGPIAIAARSQAGSAIAKLAVFTGGFRFGTVLDLHDVNFLPGGAKYGDLVGMLALGAPGLTWVTGETEESLELARNLYGHRNAENRLVLAGEADASKPASAGVQWILEGTAGPKTP